MKKWFISDTHFGHFNVILYSNRPFLFEVKENSLYHPKGEKTLEINFQDGSYFKNEDKIDQEYVDKAAARVRKKYKGNKGVEITSQEIIEDLLTQEQKYHSVKLMNETLIENWNKKIGKNDLVYFVGDFAFLGTQAITEILRKLNGKKILIKGNHDKKAELMEKAGFAEVHNELEINIGGEQVLLSHYPYVDLDLYEAAEARPNVIKIHKNGYKPTEEDIPQQKWDYPLMREYVLKFHKMYAINPHTELGQIVFRHLKRCVGATIGTRPQNRGQVLIHGHTHNENKRNHNMINMSVEAWGYGPASEGEIISLIKEIKEEMNPKNLTPERYLDESFSYYKKLASLNKVPVVKQLKEIDSKALQKKNEKDDSSVFKNIDSLSNNSNLKELKEVCSLMEAVIRGYTPHVPQNYSDVWYEKAVETKAFIPMKDLKDGSFYLGSCRNATVAKWNGKEQKFTYIREKFGARFKEDINPIEKDNGYDLFIPQEEYQPTKEELLEFDVLGS